MVGKSTQCTRVLCLIIIRRKQLLYMNVPSLRAQGPHIRYMRASRMWALGHQLGITILGLLLSYVFYISLPYEQLCCLIEMYFNVLP